MPDRLELILGDQIYVAKSELPPSLRNRLRRIAAFQNPEFYKAQAMRLSTYGKPRIIDCVEEDSRYVALPRGCLDEVREFLAELGVAAGVRDMRFAGEPLNLTFQGDLRPAQVAATRTV